MACSCFGNSWGPWWSCSGVQKVKLFRQNFVQIFEIGPVLVLHPVITGCVEIFDTNFDLLRIVTLSVVSILRIRVKTSSFWKWITNSTNFSPRETPSKNKNMQKTSVSYLSDSFSRIWPLWLRGCENFSLPKIRHTNTFKSQQNWTKTDKKISAWQIMLVIIFGHFLTF